MRRFFLVALVVVLVLVVGLVVVVQAVLWSETPRNIVVDQLQRQTGLRVEVDEVATGWWGRTTLRGLRAYLPLEDRPLIEAPTVRARHAWLIRLALRGDLALDRLVIESPRLVVRQRPDGRWNVEELQQLLWARMRRDDGGGGGGGPTLPAIDLDDAAVEIAPNGRAPVTLADVSLRGESPASQSYRVAFAAPQVGEATVSFSPRAPFPHSATFEVAPDPAVLNAFAGAKVGAVHAAGAWRGSYHDEVVNGQLVLERAGFEGHEAAGELRLRFEPDGQRVLAEIERLAVAPAGAPPVRFARGAVAYTIGGELDLERVIFTAFGIDAGVSGELDPQRQTGELRVVWQDAQRGGPIDARGRGTVTIDRSAGGRVIELRSETTGDTPWGELTAEVLGRLTGPNWTDIAGRFTAPRFALRREDSGFNLDGISAQLAFADGRLRLEQATLPTGARPRRLAARGYYDTASRRWEAAVTATSFSLPAVPDLFKPIERFTLRASGEGGRVDLQSLTLRSAGVALRAAGVYVPQVAQPLDVVLTLEQVPIRFGDEAERRLVAENLSGDLRVRGAVSPLNLGAEGELTARDLRIGADRLGDIGMQVEASVTPELAQAIAVAPQWLGGRWRLVGRIDREAESGSVELAAQDLDLGLVQEALRPPVMVEGLGQLNVRVDIPRVAPSEFTAEGNFVATAVRVETPLMPFTAERIVGDLRIDPTRVRLLDVTATADEASAVADVVLPIGGDPIRADLVLNGWTLAYDPLNAALGVSGRAAVSYARDTGRVAAEADLQTTLAIGGETSAELAVVAEGTPQRVEIERLAGSVLGGSVDGSGVIDLAELVGSDFTLTWKGLQPTRLAGLWQPFDAVEGSFDGTLLLRHTEDPRALGPLKLTMQFDAGAATLRGLTFSEGSAVGYTDGERWVLEDFELSGAGGVLSLWGRVTPQEGERFGYINVAANNLDLAQISHALDPEGAPVLGRADGELTLSTPLDAWRLAYGRGRVSVRESDFATIPLFSALNNLINLRIGGSVPDGRGQGAIRIEEGLVVLENFRYQNRGAQYNIRTLRIADIWAGGESPIVGGATVTQRLLPESTFLGELNEAIEVLQKDLVSARIAGTLGSPQVEPVALQALTQSVGEVVSGSANTERRPEPTPPAPGQDAPPAPAPTDPPALIE